MANAEEQGTNQARKNKRINKMVDTLVIRTLKAMGKDEKPMTAALLGQITNRYGRAELTADEQGELNQALTELRLTVADDDAEAERQASRPRQEG